MSLLNLGLTTVNNASGTQTPNFTLVGMYEYHQVGAMHINAPVGVADGSVFAIRIQQDADDPGWLVTWDDVYKEPSLSLAGGYLTQGASRDMLFLRTNGHAALMAAADNC